MEKEEKESMEESKIDKVPDGGFKAYSVLFGTWLLQFSTFGYINAFGAYNEYYVRFYLANYTSSEIGWIGSTQLFLLAGSGLLTGKAFDAGYFYHMVIGGAIIFTFSLFMLSLAQQGHYYQIFLAQGVGLGIGSGLCYAPTTALLSQYFDRKRAVAMGILASASAVGGALHPIMINNLLNGSVGFHNGVRASAGLCAGLLICGLLLVRTRVPPTNTKFDILPTLVNFSGDFPYVVMISGLCLATTGAFFPLFFIQVNAVFHGVDRRLAFYVVSVLNATSLFGRIIPNIVATRFGLFNTMIVCLWILAALIFVTPAVKDLTGTVVYSIMYGFFEGSYIGLVAPMVATTAKDDSEIGARLGIGASASAIGALIGTPIAAALLTKSFIWWRAYLFAGLCITVCNLFLKVTRQIYSKKWGTWRL